jgi:aryl-alcohol dehydrogenase-like predicted oxidoreductase
MTEENYDILEQLTAFAQGRDHTIGELAHAWLLVQPVISSVISGATKVEHVQANVKSVEWELTIEEFTEVNQILGVKAP